MILFLAATAMEMAPLRVRLKLHEVASSFLIGGMGPVETALQLTRYLASHKDRISRVIQFGIGGAYPERAVSLLDVCVATHEVLGDYGILSEHGIIAFDGIGAETPRSFVLTSPFFREGMEILASHGIKNHAGRFVTVNTASGTRERGETLRDAFDAICENMEGAAAARVCAAFSLPFFEIRAISNLVVDRRKEEWKVTEAIESCCNAVTSLAISFFEQDGHNLTSGEYATNGINGSDYRTFPLPE